MLEWRKNFKTMLILDYTLIFSLQYSIHCLTTAHYSQNNGRYHQFTMSKRGFKMTPFWNIPRQGPRNRWSQWSLCFTGNQRLTTKPKSNFAYGWYNIQGFFCGFAQKYTVPQPLYLDNLLFIPALKKIMSSDNSYY